MKLIADPLSGPPLLDWRLEPPPASRHKSVLVDGKTDLQHRNNRLQIGVPQVIDLKRLQHEQGSRTLNFDLFDADFLLVRLACSFKPDRRDRYVWAQLSIELATEANPAQAKPIVFDMYPIQIERQVAVKRAFELAPTAKLSFAEVSVKGTSSHESVIYEPLVSGSGLLTSAPSWTFSNAQAAGLVGSRELFLVLKVPKGARCKARIAIAAQVRGQFGPIPIRRADEEATSGDFISLFPD